jgi:DNA processing protein
MTETELIHIMALQNVPNIGDITAKKLIRHCGSAQAVFKERKFNLLKIEGIGHFVLRDLFSKHHFLEAESELEFIRDNAIKCHYFTEDSYPERLKHCVDGPVLLFESGRINFKDQRVLSIVGTRKVTSYGVTSCNALIEALAPYNPVIVSGFAYGIDITAQKAALQYNLQTVGCLAHGLNQIYPKSHLKYVERIKRHGGFLTDFRSSDDFDRNNFLKRNRIIAGLSEATIVIESAVKGGSLVTADIANSYNREVFAVPGRISDLQSEGCNDLIKYQKAHVLTRPADVPYILNWITDQSKDIVQKQLFVDLDIDEKIVCDFLKDNGRALLDIIALKCGMPAFRITYILLNLELKGVVRPLPGKMFEAI